MHEYGIMASLLERAEDEARTRGATSVERIRVDLGQLAGMTREALETAFQALSRREPFQGARLEIIEVPARVRCEACDPPTASRAFPPSSDAALPLCPECGAFFTVLQGADVSLTAVDLAVAESPR